MGILRTNTVSGIETPTPVTGSVVFDGNGDYLTLASSGDFSYETGDFTIETWIYPTALSTVNTIVANWDISYTDNEWGLILTSANEIKLQTGLTNIITSSITVPLNQWSHILVSRSSGTIRVFINGSLGGSSSTTFNFNEINSLGVGGYSEGSNPFTGYISNLRILKGTALYTSNFTPPTRELQRIGDTVLLCCNNPDSAGAEATGKAITVNGNAAASTFSPGLVRDFTYGTQFDGVSKFDTQGYFVPPSGTTEQRSRGRGVFGGGETPDTNTIDYITISTTGNAIDFGDIISSATTHMIAGCSSSTRGLFGGGRTPTLINNIDYITIATTSNALDFGDLLSPTLFAAGLSNSTRGIFAGGQTPTATNTIQYVTIASIGNAIDFGDLTINNASLSGCSSSTRGIVGGGAVPGGTRTNTIDFITISSTGNAQDFGDLTVARSNTGCSSNAIRGVFGGGYIVPTRTNIIDYITIASTGNAISFGNLTRTNDELSSCSNSNRAVFAGGGPSTRTNTIDYVTISSTGNAQDFGDLTVARSGIGACSDSHGGLS